MDEGLLNDLLECSVCLERLDTSSRVLPCQHTFCLKCLKEIVESHKELRCPECRVLVDAKVEELPPNVLLMRILEGMRNSGAPRKPFASLRNVRSGHSHQAQSHNHLTRATGSDGKPLLPHGRAIFDYTAKEPGDLSFKKGELVMMHRKIDAFWYHGECNGRTGSFPITYIQVIVPFPMPTALCKALYDFRMSAPDEEGCLAFDKGAIISVHRRVDENWAEGRLEDRVGIFPIAFVELNQAARQLMNTTSVPRPAPPTPDHGRPGHSEHRHQHSRYQPMTMSTPTTAQQANYQNMAAMSQSHPNYHPQTTQSSMPQIPITSMNPSVLVSATAIPRNIMEPTINKSLDLIHFNNIHSMGQATMGLQAVSARIGDTFENRLRSNKYDFSGNHKPETTYQNVRNHAATITNFTNSSDSSSSANTPGISSTTTPNTSSDNSTSESTEPSLPSSPDNNTTIQVVEETDEPNEAENSLNASVGVLSLNESSTATNTSLNVSLPAENNVSSSSNHSEPRDEATPCSSKTLRANGPDSLLNFGLNLQAALSPSHNKDSNYVRGARDHHHKDKEKRNSLTQSHLQPNQSTNRHSAEILATSLLDHKPERDRERGDRSDRERERRRRRSRSNEPKLPSAYVALYPYKPQKPDELELKKGAYYWVTEKCRDGWFKGSTDTRRGVFPGNYVAPIPNVCKPACVEDAPDAPPRAGSPPRRPHRQHDSLLMASAQPASFPWTGATAHQTSTTKTEKSKEKSKQEKSSISGGVSLMKRLAAMKKCKSPPPAGYSMDNPVFEDGPGTSLMLNLPSQTHHPVHVRSNDNPWQSQHRKSQSLDVTSARKDRHHSQPVKERFRCIVPYPPNSEYELELKVDDIVMVHRKRGDGWYKGTLQRTGRTGLFPASFVQSCPSE